MKRAEAVTPLTGPMIGQLGSVVTPLAVHELALRCRTCSVVFRSSEEGETHTLLRAHWATEHAGTLAALAPRPAVSADAVAAPRPPAPRAPEKSRTGPLAPTVCAAPDCTVMVIHPFPHPVARPALYCSPECIAAARRARQTGAYRAKRAAAGASPRPVVQRAKAVTGVKQPAPVTPAPVRTPSSRTCAAPFCDEVMTTGTRACCSQTCKSRKQRADSGVAVHPPKTAIEPTPCASPGCDQLVVQHPKGRVRAYCSALCSDRARAARRRAGQDPQPVVTCAADGCTETFDQGSYSRQFCSGRCKQRTAKAQRPSSPYPQAKAS